MRVDRKLAKWVEIDGLNGRKGANLTSPTSAKRFATVLLVVERWLYSSTCSPCLCRGSHVVGGG